MTAHPHAKLALRATPLAGAFLDWARANPYLVFDVADIQPIHRAFAPMVNEIAFDISELAIVTAMQAIDHGKPIVLLPITVAARFQHRCIVQNSNFTNYQPADLRGRKVAVRAYSQTTGSWVRTILEQQYGVKSASITWITEEAPHVSEVGEPDNVTRDPKSRGPFELLRTGAVTAAIFGNDMPKDDWVQPIIPSPDKAARHVFEVRNIVPINHVIALSRDFSKRQPDAFQWLYDGFTAAKSASLDPTEPDLLPMGFAAMRPSIEWLLDSAVHQGLTQRRLTFDDLFGEAAALIRE